LGEIDAAIAAVKNLLNLPGDASLTPALLRADPLWDPVRNDPRFQKLCEEKPR
jgi:serine/threonine-protein kinase